MSCSLEEGVKKWNIAFLLILWISLPFFFFFRGNLVDNVLMIIYCCHDRKCLNFLEHLWNLIAPIYVKKKKIWWAAGIFGRYEYYTNQWHNLIQKKKFITNLNCWHNFKKKSLLIVQQWIFEHWTLPLPNFWTLNISFFQILFCVKTNFFV